MVAGERRVRGMIVRGRLSPMKMLMSTVVVMAIVNVTIRGPSDRGFGLACRRTTRSSR